MRPIAAIEADIQQAAADEDEARAGLFLAQESKRRLMEEKASWLVEHRKERPMTDEVQAQEHGGGK